MLFKGLCQQLYERQDVTVFLLTLSETVLPVHVLPYFESTRSSSSSNVVDLCQEIILPMLQHLFDLYKQDSVPVVLRGLLVHSLE